MAAIKKENRQNGGSNSEALDDASSQRSQPASVAVINNPMNMREAMAKVKKQAMMAKQNTVDDLNGTKGSESWSKKQQ
jgi:hypothetical protein